MSTPKDQIWAYLHNELNPEDRTHFERVLQTNNELLEALEQCKSTQGELETILPLIHGNDAASDAPLEEKLLAEWETEHAEYAEIPAQKPRLKISTLLMPLAAAAVAVFLLNLALGSGAIDWQKTAYGTEPKLRGQNSTSSHYTRKELKQVSQELQGAVESHLNESPKPWTLKVSMQELVNGALAVEVYGHPRSDPNQPQQWSENFQSLETFRNAIPRVGKQVTDRMTGQKE